MLEVTTVVVAIGVVVEIIKRAFKMPTRFAPLLALILGIVAYSSLNGWDTEVVFQGVIVGLTASGLYSGGKATFRK